MGESYSYRNLDVYKWSFQMSMDMLNLSSKLPYEAADTVGKGLVNSAQLVSIKIAEGWLRRNRPGAIDDHIEAAKKAMNEMLLWLTVGMEYNYVSQLDYTAFKRTVEELERKMNELHKNWSVLTYTPQLPHN